MSNRTFRHKPYTGSSSDYEVAIAADNGFPTVIGDANVTFAPSTGVSAATNRIGPEKVMIKGRFTGSAAATASVVVQLWLWDADVLQWHATNGVAIGGTTTISGSLTIGMMGLVDCDPNARLGYLEVVGLITNQALEAMVTKVKSAE